MFFKNKKHPSTEAWRRYTAYSFQPGRKTSLDLLSFCVIDIETTGFKNNDEIVTVGALHITADAINLQQVLDQKYPHIQKGAEEIHEEMKASGTTKSKQKLLEELLDFIGNRIVVGHHIGFDLSRLNREIHQNFGGKLKNPSLDTLSLAQRLEPERYYRSTGDEHLLSLDKLAEYLDVDIENRHTALGDAFITACVFQKLIARMKKRGITNWGSLRK